MLKDLKKINFSEIKAIVEKANLDLPKYSISILRNIVLDPIQYYLKYLGLQIDHDLEIKFGEYDNIAQETICRNGKVCGSDTDCIMVFYNLENLSRALIRDFNRMNRAEIENEKERIKVIVKSIIKGIREQTQAVIIWHSFELPIFPSLGILDSQAGATQSAVVSELNHFLKSSLSGTPGAYYVDMNLCLMRLGQKKFYDARYWHMGRAPYTLDAYGEIALEDFKIIRAIIGKNRKCLVIDCDNTLWGGVIGEDGLSGIKLGKTYPGSVYAEFQQEIVNLCNRGVIIAICSKNNEADVWEVFRKHPDMVLKEEHIASGQINWNDKVANIKNIAQELNIGLDSIVFVDDSEFEINLVRTYLPQVRSIHLPEDKPHQFREILASLGLFDTVALSDEDKKRGAMYKAQQSRKELAGLVTDINDYYNSLGMMIEVRVCDELSRPFVARRIQMFCCLNSGINLGTLA
jgi:HAD superfamily phosphatase (TIGR01681 family)